jgi:hypothetical protein
MNKIKTIISPVFYREEKKCFVRKLTFIFTFTVSYLTFGEENRLIN